MAIRLSENFVYDVLAHFSVHDVMALNTLALGVASKLLDGLIDSIVTPSGLANLMEGKRPKQLETGEAKTKENKPKLFQNARHTYDSTHKFSIWVKDDKGDEIRFVLTRNGISWKLTNIIIPMLKQTDIKPLNRHSYSVGKSRVEDELIPTARKIMAKAKKKGVMFYLPVDCVVANAFEATDTNFITTVQEIPKGWMVMDIGPASTKLFSETLRDAKTVIWNGPMGVFEMDAFARGTFAVAEAVGDAFATTIIGGGDNDSAVRKAGVDGKVSYISTGGGAFLELLEGKILPGVAALDIKAKKQVVTNEYLTGE